MKRLLGPLTFALLLFVATPGWAVMGEENAALYRIWWESFQQRIKLRELLATTREASAFAKETASFSRAAMQVGRNTYSIIRDPERYFADAIRTWYDEFPELHATLANAYTARDIFDDTIHPERLADFDAYAYNRAFNAATMMTHSGFETLAHAVDTLGINDPHDKAIKALKPLRDGAMDNLQKVAKAMNRGGLTMVDANVHTAVSTAFTAASQAQATATLEKMNRLMEMRFSKEVTDEKKAQLERAKQDAATSRLHLKTWHLDPMPSRLGAYTETP